MDRNDNLNGIHTISVYVRNKPGVLARIAQVFSRRSFNIDSLIVSHGRNYKFSRMTIGSSGPREGLEQIIKQVNKLVDVVTCFEHFPDNTVVKELMLIKFKTSVKERLDALQIIEHFKGKTCDLTEKSIIAMFHGGTEKINAIILAISKFEIVEVVRSGKMLMARGESIT